MTSPFTPSWHAEQAPDRPAVILGTSGEVTTYSQLEDRSSRLARALRERGVGAGEHLVVLMENNGPFLDDCGAVALVASAAMADVVDGLDLTRLRVRISGAGDLPGFERYAGVLDATAPGSLDDETEGREMLYSSGTTGRPKGVRKPLPDTRFGDPSSAPVQLAQSIGLFGVDDATVYLSPAPLYHAAPLVYSMVINEYYSGTEDIGGTFITAEEWLNHPGSVGRPMSECHIVADDGSECPPGTAGIIYFAGGQPFEYHNDPEKTASMTDEHGWRTLGDIGYLDDDGYLYLTDRQAHMIISGGVNIYPQEAENVLAAHPAVADAELATYKCPRRVEFVDELPRDPNGKLYKRLLKERYWQGHGSNVI